MKIGNFEFELGKLFKSDLIFRGHDKEDNVSYFKFLWFNFYWWRKNDGK